MKQQIFPGRHTVENTEDLVVFIIGMRFNNRLAIHKWFPVFSAMPGMLKELYMNKEDLGFLSMESYYGLRTTTMIQYWRSMEDLLSYAKNEKHLTAWKKFNEKLGNNNAVGIYHETFQVKKGNYESIYSNMPFYGLGKALNHIPVTFEKNSARKRMKVE
ncbi:DUF4188 domain-containing protein [Halalkalibacter akibai]|uniref:Uncharacterized protein n=1 Tax=Halalkalibacter akibai (strain ATCC 43226 / DSM 21942 / CIP 109018 / JCM 9157 / 1139) TaxID=1236973 RepID=W4QRC2_HALA3|nr:DUF4188 domain-containing protein [Halalkalibacter akibai]GAE34457.1 hypothetical protein JCM9157_1513 [Halalkalibacter akibai JCM 9157]